MRPARFSAVLNLPESTVMIVRARMAPPNTKSGEQVRASTTAMKKVLSPSSETTMTEKALTAPEKKFSGGIQSSLSLVFAWFEKREH